MTRSAVAAPRDVARGRMLPGDLRDVRTSRGLAVWVVAARWVDAAGATWVTVVDGTGAVVETVCHVG